MEMAREVKMPYDFVTGEPINIEKLEAFAALVREDALAQPAPVQEPIAFFDPQEKGFYWAKPMKIIAPVTVDVKPLPLYTTPPAQPEERNFCPRCGKRTRDLTTIHTCTPPQ
jgi:hypothetical protein